MTTPDDKKKKGKNKNDIDIEQTYIRRVNDYFSSVSVKLESSVAPKYSEIMIQRWQDSLSSIPKVD